MTILSILLYDKDMIDLTNFSDVPREAYSPRRQSSAQPQSQQPKPVVKKSDLMKPIDSSLVDSDMAETLAREARQPESVRKHLWKPNDFEGWDYDENTIAKKRAELGMKDPDEVFKDAPFIK